MSRNQSGFSLIELMIVVAIIGILTTIAVPNFQKFQAKAKQTEAKANLSAMYAAEKAFYAEWSQYYGIFGDIGYVPEGKLNYYLSFGSKGTDPNAPWVASAGTGSGAACFETAAACATLNVQRTAAHGTTAPAGAAMNNNSFTGAASSALDPNNPATRDTWTIDQNKLTTNSVPGI